MATSAKVGSFVKDTTTGAHAQAVTGVGFQPKAIIFFHNGSTATGIKADADFGIGFSDGTNHKAVAMSSDDAAGTSVSSNSLNSANCIAILQNGSTTIDSAGDIDTFDSDGFTIGWNTATATQFIINYIAIGGTDITNVKVTKHDVPGVSNAYTGVGFQADFLMFLYSGVRAEATTGAAHGAAGWGAAISSTKEAMTMGVVESTRVTSDTWRYQCITSAVNPLDPLSGGATYTPANGIVSIDADGFTVGAAGSFDNSDDFFTLAIKGGQWDIGNFTQKTSPGTQNTAVVAGVDPGLLILSSANNTVDQAIAAGGVAQCRISFGASDTTTERCIWCGDTDAQATAEVSNSDTNQSKIIRLITEPSSLNAEADFTAHTDAQFTLDWTTADATGRLLWYIALETAGAAAAADEERYMAVSTIAPNDLGMAYMDDLYSKIAGSRTNVRTFS